ncbi:ribonuclease P protein component [Nitratiruptor sp. YY09-18]|uniref:ribonuclease P protein component n=1 Tax=Nitratiruptor sp. YY09-18 TaxID=2724901 RepID=UPI0019152EC1|nr:ribonuclease P protein component [Nitratiruptor sp. YY09-18]BCD68188.1 ribonuclease P protein component [Nitratiruptor sp. YY09-18]
METLKTQREFQRVYKNGKALHTPFFVLFYLKNADTKVGFVASKKVGKAVKRNRAKRLLRALLTNFNKPLPSGSYIFVAKPKILEVNFATLQRSFANVMQRVV